MQVGTERQAGSELHAWRQFLARSTLWLGVLLLGSAAVCWVAANWQDMTKVQRFAGAQGLLAVCALAAAWAGLRLRDRPGMRRSIPGALLALAGILLGALLALLGQTYQTGADTWELFAWWALLLLPWALAAGSQAVWLLWALVLNVAAALWLGERVFNWLIIFDGPGVPSLFMAALNLLLLLGWELAASHRRASTVFGPRILAAIAISVLVLALMFGDFVLRGLGTYNGIAWVAATLGLGFYYQRGRRDLVILAMLAAGVICVSLRVVGEWLWRLEPGVWAALPLAALLMAEAVLAARWLRRLGDDSSPALPAADAEPASASAGNAVDPADSGAPVAQLAPAAVPRAEPPWYVQCLLGLSAWLATLLLLVFVAFSGFITSEGGALVAGLVLCAAGVAVLRSDAGPFWRQCGTAMAFAGQILIIFGLSSSTSFASASFFVLLMAAVVYALGPDVILRFLSGLLIAMAGAALIWRGLSPDLMQDDLMEAWMRFDATRATFLWLPIGVIGAWATAVIITVSHRVGARRGHALQPLAWAFLLSVQGMVWLASGISATQLPAIWQLTPHTAVLIVAGALLPVAAALAVLWPRRRLLTGGVTWGVPLGLLLLALFWLPSPGVGFALAWMLLGFGLNQSRVMVFGVASLLVYLGVYYYQLELPLLQKALWLGGAALLLFVLRAAVWLVPRLMRTQAPTRSRALPPVSGALRWRTLAILGGLALVLVVANGGIWQREKLLASGKVVILELAPVDPRSLMQGDYMALNFAAGREVTRLRLGGGGGQKEEESVMGYEPDGYVMLEPDARGVAQPVRIQSEVHPHAEGEVPLRYRVRDNGVRIVTNAYFFPEGQAERYQVARYGELRVGENGEALLVRMLGPDLQPL
ncbi:GDYXXLXY domain-containing protein [Achromobacter deleyi]|uniref:GDYXXLXY domain-containing protein n=1 Tax=Achromobacter deleyi TaxID=1353891 RepID=UPI001490A8FE|nr:GDYXXLXY domain-containing protein [Achromobacter deleyi]QVQ25399.1 GDYXXLXY domain-containing protein [Achromobacter deleyi]UIP20941.1 GDYXXLXY domain-containing protein [Achromobacter deleyi]